ncbi:Carbonic AnHydrase [Chamberlinius hualienensis]
MEKNQKIIVLGFCAIFSFFGYSVCYHLSPVYPGFRTLGFAVNWSYHGVLGPDNWPYLSIKDNRCGGRQQSPINIATTTVAYTGRHIQFLNHNLIYENSFLYNNGHNVNLTIHKWYMARPRLQVTLNSGKIKTYIFDSIHYHFGDVSDHGSEHRIDNQKFPMEMHAIYVKEKYGTYKKAKNYPDGLAVVAVLCYVSQKDNEKLSAITNKLAEVSHPEVISIVPQIVLSDLFPTNTNNFFYYKGSLTTPPCYETASWYVLSQLYPVSEIQMQQFRQLTKEDSINNINEGYFYGYLADNVRPVQPLNGRRVYMHF